MKNILSQFTFKKIGVLSATILAVSALTIFSLAPRSLNVAKSEDCQNAPSVATLNPFPYSYGSTAGYGCTDFAPVVARNLTQNGSYPQSADELLAGINAQAGDVGIRTGASDRLEVVPGSGEIFDYQANLIGGAPVGGEAFTVNLGDMNACFEFSKFIRFKVRVVGQLNPVGNPQGNISANLGDKIYGQCMYNGNVSWQTQGFDTAVVKVRDLTDQGNEVVLAVGDYGDRTVDWVEPNHTYKFTLYNEVGGNLTEINSAQLIGGPACEVPQPEKTGWIRVTEGGQVSGQCLRSGTVEWGTENVENVKVLVNVDGRETFMYGWMDGNEQIFWLEPNKTYQFILRGDGFEKTQNLTVSNLNCGGPTPTPNINFNLTTRTNEYCVGETPQYSITSSSALAGKKILWSSFLNGTATQEIDADYGFYLDGSGNWSAYGNPWIPSNVGSWRKEANIDGVRKSVSFTVGTASRCNPTPQPSICPAGSVQINPSVIYVNEFSNASAPAGWSGGSFASSNTSVANITDGIRGTSVKGFAAGTASISGNGFTAPNGATNCNLSPTTITVRTRPATTPTEVTATASATASATAYASCADGTTASASASASATASATAAIRTDAERIAYDKAFALAQAQAYAQAQAKVTCSTPTPTPSNAIMELTKTVRDISQNGEFAHAISARQGEEVEYKIFVRATTNINLRNVRVTDEIPLGLSYVSGSLKVNNQSHATGLTTGGLVFDTVNQSGITITYRMTVNVNSGTLVNVARATADNAQNRQDSANINVVPTTPGQPALSIIKEVKNFGPSQTTGFATSINAKKNDTVQYKITIRNLGNATASNVVVNDSNPIGGSISGLNVSKSYTGTVQNGLNFGDLAANESVIITYSATVNIEQGTIQNTATVSAQNASSQQAIAIVNVIKDQEPSGPGGNCNNSNNSCNTNNNQNNQTNNNSTNSSNQNSNTNINGNNNTVTTTNQNCVNNSCNNTNLVYINQAGGTVPGNEFRQLAITKLVRNVNGGAFQDSISANSGDTVEFEIVVRNSGNQVINNVQVSDSLNSGLNLVSGTVRVDGNYSGDYLNNINLGSIMSGQQKRVVFQARVNVSGSQSIQNTARASGDSASQVQDDAWVFVQGGSVQGGSVNLVYSKRANNDTKNADATSVIASREDYIIYTLTVTNTGNSPATSFVVTDDLSQVLPYADIVDNGGGVLSGNVISYSGITVPAGGSVSKSFRVRVKYYLTANLSYTMTNTYGNTITVRINTPQVLGAFVAPKTGADTLSLTFGGILTLAFAGFRKRKYLLNLIFA
ncbi:MAG: hypothetical protein NTX98_01130 [Candidatus Doudnabacteria bacterium]|nr:hypothetical protein [Candidatus Doudnabacteria bacterium]